ncbi:type VI secretion system protein VasJ [Herbaspirillum sp. Sphag1AN]|uniref:type VI secretion system protein TssA n=1 Tax=unclassified Herbaspirillum TaxID=2624150 RepID=UPI00162214D2|nr:MULTISPECIES: type VI secretion system protein TssA [unclassified Herbaspirillum]MBB3213268.1 type VI secretion system protein VasJ [Herbaspirillum sp. Sphag1AN]MBB3246465.1 type VI secretion system protein VasJ [Herbaspirillum sp. Sphag64]
MMTKFLNALFGNRPPGDLARSSQEYWRDWLLPINPNSVLGDDLTYDDDFLAIKEEVAKLSDIDDALIVSNAERLLKFRAKDVRPAVYYVYGRLRQEGAEGLANGLELLSALVDRFDGQLLPQRLETRKAALEWLTGTSFGNQLERIDRLQGAVLERCLSALALIAECTAHWPEVARPQLDGLYRRFETCVEGKQDDALTESENSLSVPTGSAKNAKVTFPVNAAIGSSRDLLERAREMALFLREQSQGYLAAYRLLRCVRWDTLTDVPPHDTSGKTRLVAPRTELRSQLKRLLLQKQWPDLLDRVEQAFVEGANHFWLDLQYYAHTAQGYSGGEYAQTRDLAATDCALMLERLPGMQNLSFSDGSPFAEDTTLEWIGRYATVRNIERGEPVVPAVMTSIHPDWGETETQAFDVLQQRGLESALDWLQSLPPQKGARHGLVQQLVMARLSERAERLDVALHLLTVADATARRYDLDTWEPVLAFELKQYLLRLLALRMNRKDVDKLANAQRMDSLLGELTALDPARAAGLA